MGWWDDTSDWFGGFFDNEEEFEDDYNMGVVDNDMQESMDTMASGWNVNEIFGGEEDVELGEDQGWDLGELGGSILDGVSEEETNKPGYAAMVAKLAKDNPKLATFLVSNVAGLFGARSQEDDADEKHRRMMELQALKNKGGSSGPGRAPETHGTSVLETIKPK